MLPSSKLFGLLRAGYKGLKRPLHTDMRHIIEDQNGAARALILQVSSDQNTPDELSHNYQKRSRTEFVKEIPEELKNSGQILIFKLQPSVIDDMAWKFQDKTVMPVVIGHIEGGLYTIDGEKLIQDPHTAISKRMGKGYEDSDEIDSNLFTSPGRNRMYKKAGAEEYYVVIPKAMTNIDREEIIDRLEYAKMHQNTWVRDNAACSQAIYDCMTGQKLNEKQSAQTGAVSTIFAILNDKDDVFVNNFKQKIEESGLNKPAYQLGQELRERKETAATHEIHREASIKAKPIDEQAVEQDKKPNYGPGKHTSE